MKKMLLFAPAALLSAMLFTSCTKDGPDNKVFDASFYTTDMNTPLSLYIDDVYRGELAYFQTKPACGAVASDGPKALGVQLKSGTYKITGKDAQGNVRSTSTVRLSASGHRATGGIGGLTLEDNGSCVTVGLRK